MNTTKQTQYTIGGILSDIFHGYENINGTLQWKKL